MKLFHSWAFGLALASGAASVQAQGVITRQVTQEPVETTITQGPSGTVVTRRPLGPAPLAPALGAIAVEQGVAPAYDPYDPYAAQPPASATYVDETVGVAPAPTRTVTVRRPAPARTVVRSSRSATTAETTGSGARTVQRTAVRRTTVQRTVQRTTVRRTAAPLVLDPVQRRVIYRTVVQERIVPNASVYPAPAYPAYPAARTVVVPATTGTGYGVAAPADEVYDDDEAPPVYAPAAAPVIYPIGARLPAGVALAPVPQTLAVRVPAVRAYRTVLINNRVLLVDPVTSTVVADVTQ
jgi:hypothetical protein